MIYGFNYADKSAVATEFKNCLEGFQAEGMLVRPVKCSPRVSVSRYTALSECQGSNQSLLGRQLDLGMS